MKLIWKACSVWRTSERLSSAVRHPHLRWENKKKKKKEKRQKEEGRGDCREEEWVHAGIKRARK